MIPDEDAELVKGRDVEADALRLLELQSREVHELRAMVEALSARVFALDRGDAQPCGASDATRLVAAALDVTRVAMDDMRARLDRLEREAGRDG